eukprot:gene10467-2989_t
MKKQLAKNFKRSFVNEGFKLYFKRVDPLNNTFEKIAQTNYATLSKRYFSTSTFKLNGTNSNMKYEIVEGFSTSPKYHRKIWNRDVTYCGEDAYFISKNENEKIYAFGIADGVGGWSEIGVDPSEFSWELMNECKKCFESNRELSPKDVLITGYSELIKNQIVKAGSSTACLLTINFSNENSPVLKSTNLGDSGYIVIRDDKVVYKTKEQQHFFNAPFQLSVVPESMRSRGSIMDKAEDSEENELKLKLGDYIVLSTDGLFDNVSEKEIIEVISSEQDDNVENISKSLVKLAEKKSKSETNETPFSLSAKQSGYYFRGGKIDDITVIVVKVQ